MCSETTQKWIPVLEKQKSFKEAFQSPLARKEVRAKRTFLISDHFLGPLGPTAAGGGGGRGLFIGFYDNFSEKNRKSDEK